ncbi:MAG: PAS domain-containing sensor histidine kinase [Pyrinomonadaceae bacterium]
MSQRNRPAQNTAKYEQRILFLALMTGLPGAGVALALLWSGGFTAKVQWTLSMLIVSFWWGFAFALRERVVRHLQTLANLLAALREEDFSIRARGARRDDALGEVMLEVNALGETLREQRLGALEASALLRAVMAEIDVAVFAFDQKENLRLVNRAGERLLAQPFERLIGLSAADIGLRECLQGEASRTLQHVFPGGAGRWGVRRSSFQEGGVRHQLLVVADLSRALRDEEREAWQRLVRVLGHELNNSLAPISSIAGSLETLLVREPRPSDWREDMLRGLTVIGSRSAALSRFMSAYARLARLPSPRLSLLDVGAWVRRVVELETRLNVEVQTGPELFVQADGDQLEQLLINLLRNAVDAALETGGGVRVSWTKNGSDFYVSIEDEGFGLLNSANLFVPFFTTKQGGAGIGLVLSRQIAEAHGGTLTLENRQNSKGCIARLRLPLQDRVSLTHDAAL